MDLAQFIATALRRWRNVTSGSREPEHLRLGREGEKLAAAYLRRSGMKVLYRNFRPRHGGEIDLVCRDRRYNSLVFVEVKSRSGTWFGEPAAAVDRAKRRRLCKGAMEWLRLLDNPDISFRFDVVEVVFEERVPRCHWIENAFELTHPYRY